jgi:hypothetical protein
LYSRKPSRLGSNDDRTEPNASVEPLSRWADFVAKAGFDPGNGCLAAFLTASPCRLLLVERRRQRFEQRRFTQSGRTFTQTQHTPRACPAVDAR